MLYDYRCKSCQELKTANRAIADRNNSLVCDNCGGDCGIVILGSPVISLDPISGDHTIATAKWEKHRNQQMAKEKKCMKEHGTYN